MNVVKIWLVSLVFIIVTYSLHHFRSVFSLFFIAMVAAYIFNPAVQFFQNKTRNLLYRDEQTKRAYRGFAVFIVLMFVFVIVSLCFGSLRAKVVYQLVGLLEELPQMKAGFQNLMVQLEEELVQLDIPSSIIQPLQDFIAQFDVYVAKLTMQVLAALAELTTHLFDMVLIVILLVYFMLDGEKIIESLHQFLMEHQLNRISQLVRNANDMIWAYIKSRVLISAGMALTVYVGLTLGHIRYAGLFALMSFLLDFIPYFGSLFGGIVITLFSLITYDVSTAVKVGVFILVVQQIEGNVVVPKVQGDQIKVHPLLILLAILLCNAIWGPVGMLFAVPLAGLAKNIFVLMVEFLLTPSGNVRQFLSETSNGTKAKNEESTTDSKASSLEVPQAQEGETESNEKIFPGDKEEER